MKKALLNSDVINDNEHIYLLSPNNIFDLYKFSILNGDLTEAFISAYKTLKELGIECSFALIPFAVYHNNVCIAYEDDENIGINYSLEEKLEMIGIKLKIKVMIPDQLKDKTKPI